MLRLLRLQFWKLSLKQYQQLKSQKQYRQILNASPQSRYEQMRVNFFQLIKEYHPDKSAFNPEFNKGEGQEITKIITQAYTVVTNQHMTEQKGKRSEPDTEEDKIYYQVFKKHRSEDPYAFYNPENENLRKAYISKVGQMAKSDSKNTKGQQKQAKTDGKTQKRAESNPLLTFGIVFVTGALALSLYLYLPKHQDAGLQPLTNQMIDEYQRKWRARIKERARKVLNHYQSEQPPSLSWHPFGDVPLLQQLFRYSILPDVQFFEVSPQLFDKNNDSQSIPTEKIQMHPINKIKPNTLMSLSLEAERCLHNIYVSKQYLLKELKTKGYFECPPIFFRFHGYICCKLRRKPISLVNYKGQKWISLFDLYFRYYSPAFYFADHFNTYFTTEQQNPLYFGDIHLNTKNLRLVHLSPQQKNVFMWASRGGDHKKYEEKYRQIWTDYYKVNVPQD